LRWTGAILDAFDHVVQFPGLAVDRLGRPVVAAQFVEHGATDADGGVGLEAGTLAGIVLLPGIEQADHADLDEIVHQHRGRQMRSSASWVFCTGYMRSLILQGPDPSAIRYGCYLCFDSGGQNLRTRSLSGRDRLPAGPVMV